MLAPGSVVHNALPPRSFSTNPPASSTCRTPGRAISHRSLFASVTGITAGATDSLWCVTEVRRRHAAVDCRCSRRRTRPGASDTPRPPTCNLHWWWWWWWWLEQSSWQRNIGRWKVANGHCHWHTKLHSYEYIVEFLQERNSVCIGDFVNKRGAGRQHNYLYIYSPGGACSAILFPNVIVWH